MFRSNRRGLLCSLLAFLPNGIPAGPHARAPVRNGSACHPKRSRHTAACFACHGQRDTRQCEVEPTPREGTNPAHSQPSEPGPSQPEAAEQAATRTQAQSKARPPAQSKAPPVTKTTQLEKPDTKARPNGKDTKDPKRTKPEPEDDDEYEAPVEDHPPPPLISKATLMKRLARICAPKADGTYKVPLEIIQTHKNLDTRDEVYRAFEKCGGDPVLPSRLLTVTNGTSARKAGSEGECTCIFFYV